MYIDNPLRMRRFQHASLLFAGVVVLYFLSFFAGASTLCKTYYRAGVPTPAGFGVSNNPFVAGDGLRLDCANGVVTFSLGYDGDVWKTIVYEKGYKYVTTGTPHWQEFAFSGERIAAGSPWITKKASAVLPASLLNPGKNFVVAYECTNVGGGYRCGCRDYACKESFWQLEAFDAPTGAPPPPTGDADLMLDAIRRTPADATIAKGTLVSFTGTVANHGTGTAGASQTRLFIDGTAISSDQTTGSLVAEGNETETWTNAWTATEGTHTFRICADSGSAISELVENNNCTTSASFTVTVTAPPPPPATGFWDEGFKQGIVRSDSGDIKDITMGACLYYDAGRCTVDACAVCQTSGAKNYSRSNFYSSVSPAPTDSFWVLDHNDDSGGLGGAFSNSCHTGPPNQSFQVGSVGSHNVFGFTLEDVASGKRARLALKNQYNACGSDAIPYLGIGAQKNRGNNDKNVGSFIKGKSGLRVNFTASLDKCDKRTDGVNSPCLIYFDVITRWNGKPRQFFIYLAHQNHPGSPNGAHVHWNWPSKNSYFYPGSDLAYLNCETVGTPCLVRGQTKDFSIDVDKMLINASNRGLFDDKIPEGTEIPIEGIHWSIETAGPSAGMEATVSNMTTQVLTY